MVPADTFFGARLKLERAWIHIEDLATQVYDYAHSAQVTFGDYEPSKKTRAIKIQPKPSPLLACIIGDAVHNLRSTLDHLVCNLAEKRCGVKNKHKFPFAFHEDDLDSLIQKNGFHEIGHDLIRVVKFLKPYGNGNARLRGLHDLDIKDKHQLLIPSFFKSFAYINAANFIADGFIAEQNRLMASNGFTGVTASKLVLEDGSVIPYVDDGRNWQFMPIVMDTSPKMNLRDGEDCWIGNSGDPYLYIRPDDKPLDFVFLDGSNLPFSGKPVLETLHDLANLVESIVELFATEFGNGDRLPAIA